LAGDETMLPINMLTRYQGLYTALVVCLNVIAGGGGSNLYLPEEFDTFTPLDIQERIKGSKIVIVSEQVFPSHSSSSVEQALTVQQRQCST
jgi:hypothetical protein